jgi:hypothetical protein
MNAIPIHQSLKMQTLPVVAEGGIMGALRENGNGPQTLLVTS